MFNFLNLKKENNKNQLLDVNYLDEKIYIDSTDYYFSNVVTRASKTMLDCHNVKTKRKNTGTEG